MLNSGKTPIFEDGLEELMQKKQKRLTYTTDYKLAYKDSDVIIITVGTTKKDRSANLEFHLPDENNGIDEFLFFAKKCWINYLFSDIVIVKIGNLW